jgi:hypothetical protein
MSLLPQDVESRLARLLKHVASVSHLPAPGHFKPEILPGNGSGRWSEEAGMDDNHSGSCLCGAVRFRTSGPLRGVVYCHCSQCRKQSGHFYAATNVLDANIAITGAENLTWYEASPFARRGFCRRCGSALFWKPRDNAYVSVLAGSFDEPTSLQGECHIFVGDKGDYYSIDDGLPQFEKSTPSIKVADE